MDTIARAVLKAIESPLPAQAQPFNNPLYHCILETDAGHCRGVLKLLGRRKILAETSAWLLAKHLGLPVLDAFLVEIPSALPAPEGAAFPKTPLHFATRAETLSTLKDSGIDWASPFWEAAAKTAWFQTLLAFDVLVGNYDRVVRNVLFRGEALSGTLVLADHERIFHRARWTALELAETQDYPGYHHFSRFAAFLTGAAKAQLVERCGDFSRAFREKGPPDLAPLSGQGLASSLERKAIRRFFEFRARHLPELVEHVLANP